MSRRRNADGVARLLREADRDLARGLTISVFCREQELSAHGQSFSGRHRDRGLVQRPPENSVVVSHCAETISVHFMPIVFGWHVMCSPPGSKAAAPASAATRTFHVSEWTETP